MAEAFLGQLLTPENRVQSEDNAHCFVCLQIYGTLTDTGAIECEIRLPCNHRLGSMCAFTWLKSNNTCPFCREELFPAQPHSDIEDVPMGDIIPNLSGARRVPEPLREMIRSYCVIFGWEEGFFNDAFRIAEPMAETLRQLVQDDGFCLNSIAATAAYIMLHLLDRPKSSVEISRELLVEENVIRSIYTRVYADREILIHVSMLEVLGRGRMEGILGFLPPPAPYEEVIGDKYQGPSTPGFMFLWLSGYNARCLKLLCGHAGDEMGLEDSVGSLVQQIAETIQGGRYPGVLCNHRTTAVSIFLALHLVGRDTSYEEIQQCTGVAASIIRDTYHQVYPNRSDIVNSRSLQLIGEHDRSRAIDALTDLPWPQLHPDVTVDPVQENNESVDGVVTDSPTQDDDDSEIDRRRLESFCSSLSLNAQVTELSYRVVLRLRSANDVGASHLHIAAVSIYHATRVMGRPVPYEEISTVVGLPSDVVRFYSRTLVDRQAPIEEIWFEIIGRGSEVSSN